MTMMSRASSTSRSSHAERSPFFPKAAGPGSLQGRSTSLPLRPHNVCPSIAVDCINSGKPIPEFNGAVHAVSYHPRAEGVDADLPPQQPEGFSDAYLMPSLTRHERLRLTMFWYYTRDILEDEDFLRCLQEKLELVQILIGWEFAIVGLLSEDVFTRLVTAGLPLAIVPRRESPCSHTVNQTPGVSSPFSISPAPESITTPFLCYCHFLIPIYLFSPTKQSVFMLPDMSRDWRFKNSPMVTHGGLRAYAGAQLRCKALNGEEIALGSLCVAASAQQLSLTSAQQGVLVRFADVISSEMVNRSREARKQQRHRMACLLAEARADGPGSAEERTLSIIRQVYPGVTVDVQTFAHGRIRLVNHDDVDYEDFVDGLWEDGPVIEQLIQTNNHTKLETKETVRAIAWPCHTYLEARYLVVASNQIQNVFDDVDSWFIEACANQLRHAIQESHLKEALKAKETFMRGITHQLRTPIHGVLVSCELLGEELARLNLMSNALEGSAIPSTSSALNTIRESARELMSTINNILKMNRWAENLRRPEPAPVRSLRQMEIDIMYELQQLVPEAQFAKTSIFFENKIPADEATFEIDTTLLKECIQALILNAVLYNDGGAVVTVISASADHSRLIVDVCDTGIGIHPDDQSRIFEAYEKVDTHSRGAGLGLSIARKIAIAMDGNVTLVSSSQDILEHGSHFCAEFHSPRFSMPQRQINDQRATSRSSYTFHVLPGHGPLGDLIVSQFSMHLERHGYHQVDMSQATAVILPYTADADEFVRLVESVQSRQVAVCLLPAGIMPETLPSIGDRMVLFFAGPFLTSRLEAIRKDMDAACRQVDVSPTQSDETAGSTSDSSTMPLVNAEPYALLVDDNVINLRILRMYCEKRKIPYVTAIDGQEAFLRFQEALEGQQKLEEGEQAPMMINLVLMDLQMPVCDGVEATARIRGLEKDYSSNTKTAINVAPSHIFMVTGQDSVGDKNRSFEAGADEFYVKPMSLKDLDRGIADRFPGFRRRLGSPSPKSKKREQQQ